ncbi:hypothetical protein EYF80_005005 [Liparis tanakae]|uniref:Uncharacterized protein n=1 Tax=Liparis tanakae TaxID=230148 RepID=A0A4Z2J446_9TELE|nr:hypothetical protein EYF80_005005 [Liparis tanakae]
MTTSGFDGFPGPDWLRVGNEPQLPCICRDARDATQLCRDEEALRLSRRAAHVELLPPSHRDHGSTALLTPRSSSVVSPGSVMSQQHRRLRAGFTPSAITSTQLSLI